jgi:hypothetical protein
MVVEDPPNIPCCTGLRITEVDDAIARTSVDNSYLTSGPTIVIVGFKPVVAFCRYSACADAARGGIRRGLGGLGHPLFDELLSPSGLLCLKVSDRQQGGDVEWWMWSGK